MTGDDIQNAINKLGDVGGVVNLDPIEYLVSNTIVVKSNVTLIGAPNRRTRLTLVDSQLQPGRGRAKPLITTVGKNIVLSDFCINGNGLRQWQPQNPDDADDPNWPDVSTGSAVMVQSDFTTITRLVICDAWDNGLMVKQFPNFDLTKRGQNGGCPHDVTIDQCVTISCGIGPRVMSYPKNGTMHNETKGAGINVGTGSKVSVMQCLDIASSTGFTCEYWGGAEASFKSCFAKCSKQRTPNEPGGTGIGFWIGSTSSLDNCRSIATDSYGFVVVAQAETVSFNACTAVAPGGDGFSIDPQVKVTKVDCGTVRNPGRTEIWRVFPIPELLDQSSEDKIICADGSRLFMCKSTGGNPITVQIWQVSPDLKLIHSTNGPLSIAAGENALYMVKESKQIWQVWPELKQIHSTNESLDIAASGDRLYMVKASNQIWQVLPDLKPIYSTNGPLSIAAGENALYMVKESKQIWQVWPELKQIHSTNEPLSIAASGDRLYMVKASKQIWQVLPNLEEVFDLTVPLTIAMDGNNLFTAESYR